MMRNALVRLFVLGTAVGLAACAAPDATDTAVEPGVVATETSRR